MRLVAAMLLPVLVGCSAGPGEPTQGPDAGSRTYACDVPKPPPTTGGATFTALYDDFVSPKGAARCQSVGCHGGDNGQNQLSLGVTRADALRGFQEHGLVAKAGPPKSCTTAKDCDGFSCDKKDGLCQQASGILDVHDDYMPKERCDNRKLTKDEIARITAWGKAGANDD